MAYGTESYGSVSLGSKTESRPVFGTQPISTSCTVQTAKIQYFLIQEISAFYNLENSSLLNLNIGSQKISASYTLRAGNLTTGTVFNKDIKYKETVRQSSISGSTTMQSQGISASYNVSDSNISGETLATTEIITSTYGLESSGITPVFSTEEISASYIVETSIILNLATEEISASVETGDSSLQDLYLVGDDIAATYSTDASAFDVLGTNGEITVLIDGQRIDTYTNIEAKRRLNEVDTFSFEAFIEDDSDRALIQEGNEVKIIENYKSLLFKGVLNEVEYKSSFRAKCEGNGMVQKLLNRKTNRDTYNNVPGDEVITGNNSLEGVVPENVITYGDIESAPSISLRFDHDNLARATAGVANAVGYDWYIDQKEDDDFETDYLNFVRDAGRDTVQETFDIGGNAQMVERNKDEGFVANNITLLGRGDGINQLEAQVFAASTAFTDTTAVIEEDSLGDIKVEDATKLGSIGDDLYVRVGTEVMNVFIDDSTTLSIFSRGYADYKGDETEQIRHYEGVRVWLVGNLDEGIGRFSPNDPQQGSSIDTRGVKELRDTDKTIVDLSTLEKTADLELKNRFEDVFRVQVQPTDPRATKDLQLGDTVEVEDLTAMDVSDEFSVVGMDVMRNSSDEGTVLHLANRPRRLTERLSEIESDKDTLNAHMQGATNFNGEHFEDNVDETHPLNNKIFVPDDVVRINKFDLTFARESFRGYTESTDEESAHTHNVELNPVVDENDNTRFLEHRHDVDSIDSVGTHASGAQLIIPANTDFNPTVQHSDIQLGTISAEIPNPTGFNSSDTEEILFELEIANFGDSGDLFEWRVENEQGESVIDFDQFVSSGSVYNYTATIDTSGSFSAEPGDVLTYYPEGGEFDHSSSRDATDKKSYVKIRVSPRAEKENTQTSDLKLDSQKSETSDGGGKHSHSMNYGIFEPGSEPDVDVEVRVDGNLVKTVKDVAVGDEITEPIELKGDLDDPLTGAYHDITLTPVETVADGNNGRARLSADVTEKVFIESTL